MIEEIIKLRGDGLSFRRIASKLNTTVGKVQYRWNKWNNSQGLKQGSNGTVLNKQSGLPSETDLSIGFVPMKGELQAKLVSPRKIILFWEVSLIPEKLIRLYFNCEFENLVHSVRVYDVTEVNFTGKNAHHYYEIAIPYHKGFWFIKGLAANRSYLAELGVKFNEKEFFPVLRSNSVQTPMMELGNGNEFYDDLLQFQQLEDLPPKWIDHVSTYSYYEKSKDFVPET